jgi:glycine dehydrogenase subunit 1
MLDAIGVETIEALFDHIPFHYRQNASLNLHAPLSEQEVQDRLASLADLNVSAKDWAIFVGAGCYYHFSPSVVDAIISRSEFMTSYTPYQAEASQGTLEAIFEFQTLICQMTSMDIANAGLYDGASAAAEAVLMARRLNPKGKKVLLSEALHPNYAEVIKTYLRNQKGVKIVGIPYDARGRVDEEVLKRELQADVLCAVVSYPNFFGIVEDLEAISSFTKPSGVFLISVTPEPTALGLLQPPGVFGIDIAVGEGQSLGLPMSYGGPAFGFFASTERYLRAMPGRIVGQTTDRSGNRGFVLTLATREQHIRRAKATSNVCTNQNLCTLAATVYLSLLGKDGFRQIAKLNCERAHELFLRLTKDTGARPLFTGPFFNEFAVEIEGAQEKWKNLQNNRILAGLPLADFFPSMKNGLLLCATEMNQLEDMDRIVKGLQ